MLYFLLHPLKGGGVVVGGEEGVAGSGYFT
jgi:hypothetical protein